MTTSGIDHIVLTVPNLGAQIDYPASGGTYVYGRECLGPFWGFLAGWGFVVGKTAGCAAMALPRS